MNSIFVFILLFLSGFLYSQKTYQFEEIAELQKVEKRNLFIFISTDWCKYCQQMKHSVLKNKNVQNLLDQKLYFIHLDAEEKRDIVFSGKKFSYQPHGNNTGLHELAQTFIESEKATSFPYLLILNPSNEIIFQSSGFLNSQEMFSLLENATLHNK